MSFKKKNKMCSIKQKKTNNKKHQNTFTESNEKNKTNDHAQTSKSENDNKKPKQSDALKPAKTKKNIQRNMSTHKKKSNNL